MPCNRFTALVGLIACAWSGAGLAGQVGVGWDGDEDHRVVAPGVKVGAHYFADWSGIWQGGVRHRDGYRSLTDLHCEVDGGPLLGSEGTTVFLDGYHQVGRDAALDSGDLQVYSNLDGPNRTQLASLWVQQVFADGAFRIKVGKVDANTEFAALPNGGDFIHSSAGYSPTIVGFPSYPDPAMSVNLALAVAPSDRRIGWSLRAGLYDGSTAAGLATGPRGPSTFFDGGRTDARFTVVEGALSWASGSCAIGGWHHSADLPRFDGGTEPDTVGGYALLDQQVFAESPARDDPQGIRAMVSMGWTDAAVSPIAAHYAAGIYLAGPIPGRDRDTAGVFVSHVEVSDASGAPPVADETACEVFYRVRVSRHLFVPPVLQYVRHPAGAAGVGEALIGTLRFELRWQPAAAAPRLLFVATCPCR